MSSDAIGDALTCLVATSAVLGHLLKEADFPDYAREWGEERVQEIDELVPRLREKWREAI